MALQTKITMRNETHQPPSCSLRKSQTHFATTSCNNLTASGMKPYLVASGMPACQVPKHPSSSREAALSSFYTPERLRPSFLRYKDRPLSVIACLSFDGILTRSWVDAWLVCKGLKEPLPERSINFIMVSKDVHLIFMISPKLCLCISGNEARSGSGR